MGVLSGRRGCDPVQDAVLTGVQGGEPELHHAKTLEIVLPVAVVAVVGVVSLYVWYKTRGTPSPYQHAVLEEEAPALIAMD